MNKTLIYDAMLVQYGYDAHIVRTAETCSALAAACCQFVSHRGSGVRIADQAAEVEIMLEQLRHFGLGGAIDVARDRTLAHLARLTGHDDGLPGELLPLTNSGVNVSLSNIEDRLFQARNDYHEGNPRKAAQQLRAVICRAMQLAQHLVSQAQRESDTTIGAGSTK